MCEDESLTYYPTSFVYYGRPLNNRVCIFVLFIILLLLFQGALLPPYCQFFELAHYY